MADGDAKSKSDDMELVRLATEATNTMFSSGAVEKGKSFGEVFSDVFGTLQGAASGQVAGGPASGFIRDAAAAEREKTKDMGARHPERDGPAVPIDKSVKPDHIVCLEDGKKLKMLTRYLKTSYNMNPDQYRTKWGLPRDYPMIAPNSSKLRSKIAKERPVPLGKTDHERTGRPRKKK
ncbi:MAG: MucR family transcriptional regulator [Rhodospirillales bacterium]